MRTSVEELFLSSTGGIQGTIFQGCVWVEVTTNATDIMTSTICAGCRLAGTAQSRYEPFQRCQNGVERRRFFGVKPTAPGARPRKLSLVLATGRRGKGHSRAGFSFQALRC